MRDAASLCNELGHEVHEAAPAYGAELMWQSFTTILSAGFGWAVDDWSRRIGRTPTSEFFEPFVWSFTRKGHQISGPDYLMALQDVQKETRNIARFFVDYDIWLTPTLGKPPVPLETFKFSEEDPFE